MPHQRCAPNRAGPRSSVRAGSSGSKSSLPSALYLHQGPKLQILLASISTSGAEDSAFHAAGLQQASGLHGHVRLVVAHVTGLSPGRTQRCAAQKRGGNDVHLTSETLPWEGGNALWWVGGCLRMLS